MNLDNFLFQHGLPWVIIACLLTLTTLCIPIANVCPIWLTSALFTYFSSQTLLMAGFFFLFLRE